MTSHIVGSDWPIPVQCDGVDRAADGRMLPCSSNDRQPHSVRVNRQGQFGPVSGVTVFCRKHCPECNPAKPEVAYE